MELSVSTGACGALLAAGGLYSGTEIGSCNLYRCKTRRGWLTLAGATFARAWTTTTGLARARVAAVRSAPGDPRCGSHTVAIRITTRPTTTPVFLRAAVLAGRRRLKLISSGSPRGGRLEICSSVGSSSETVAVRFLIHPQPSRPYTVTMNCEAAETQPPVLGPDHDCPNEWPEPPDRRLTGQRNPQSCLIGRLSPRQTAAVRCS